MSAAGAGAGAGAGSGATAHADGTDHEIDPGSPEPGAAPAGPKVVHDEWSDFSNASPWEEFVCSVEGALREWGVGSDPQLQEDVLVVPGAPGSGGGSADTAGLPPGKAGTASTTQSRLAKPSKHSRVLSYSGVEYKLSYYTAPPSASAAALWRRLHHLPRGLVECLDPGLDFRARAHRLTRWFGVLQFIVLSPVQSTGPGFAFDVSGVSATDSAMLLSTVRLALSNLQSSVPAFVPVHEPSRGCYHGFLSAAGLTARLRVDALPETPAAYAHLAGLRLLFLAHRQAENPLDAAMAARAGTDGREGEGSEATGDEVVASCRYTWSWNPHEHVLSLAARAHARGFSPLRRRPRSVPHHARTSSDLSLGSSEGGLEPGLQWRQESDATMAEDPVITVLRGPGGTPLWGPGYDPVAVMHLSASWDSFKCGGGLTDNAVYSDLIARKAPTWRLGCVWAQGSSTTRSTGKDRKAKLSTPDTGVSTFGECPLAGMIHRLGAALQRAATLDADLLESPARDLAAPLSAAASAEGRAGGPASSPRDGDDDEFEGMEDMPAARAAAVVGAVLAATLVPKLESPREIEERRAAVRGIIRELFDGPRLPPSILRGASSEGGSRGKWRALAGVGATPRGVSRGGHGACGVAKSAPVASLASLLALRASELGRLDDIGLTWLEFLRQLRLHWDSGTPLPRMPSASDSIDNNSCLLHQKLQLLNECIERRRRLRAMHASGVVPVVRSESGSGLGSPRPIATTAPVVPSTPGGEAGDGGRGSRETGTRAGAEVEVEGEGGGEGGSSSGEGSEDEESGDDGGWGADLELDLDLDIGEGSAECDADPLDELVGVDEGGTPPPTDSPADDAAGTRSPDAALGSGSSAFVDTESESESDDEFFDATEASRAEIDRAAAGVDRAPDAAPSTPVVGDGQGLHVFGTPRTPVPAAGAEGDDVVTTGSVAVELGAGGIDSSAAAAEEADLPAREGAVRALEGMKLLRSGRQMFEPELQPPQLMTEDMAVEQQYVFARMGDSAEASAVRQRLQARSLRSDMSAFKAANPGSDLEDFVRWHSPKDWQPDPEPLPGAPPRQGPSMGRLSVRMRARSASQARVDGESGGGSGAGAGAGAGASGESGEPENIWQRTWANAPAVPAAGQRPLFDTTSEGEKVLNFLEAITVPQLLTQLVACLFAPVVYVLRETWPLHGESETDAKARANLAYGDMLLSLIERFSRVAVMSGGFTLDAFCQTRTVAKSGEEAEARLEAHVDTIRQLATAAQALCAATADAETTLARSVSLTDKFPGQAALVRRLVEPTSASDPSMAAAATMTQDAWRERGAVASLFGVTHAAADEAQALAGEGYGLGEAAIRRARAQARVSAADPSPDVKEYILRSKARHGSWPLFEGNRSAAHRLYAIMGPHEFRVASVVSALEF